MIEAVEVVARALDNIHRKYCTWHKGQLLSRKRQIQCIHATPNTEVMKSIMAVNFTGVETQVAFDRESRCVKRPFMVRQMVCETRLQNDTLVRDELCAHYVTIGRWDAASCVNNIGLLADCRFDMLTNTIAVNHSRITWDSFPGQLKPNSSCDQPCPPGHVVSATNEATCCTECEACHASMIVASDETCSNCSEESWPEPTARRSCQAIPHPGGLQPRVCGTHSLSVPFSHAVVVAAQHLRADFLHRGSIDRRAVHRPVAHQPQPGPREGVFIIAQHHGAHWRHLLLLDHVALYAHADAGDLLLPAR